MGGSGHQPEIPNLFSSDPTIIAETKRGHALHNVLTLLPAATVITQTVTETASADKVSAVLGQNAYLQSLARSVAAETGERVELTTKYARSLGVCVAAATVESAAAFYRSYGIEALVGDINTKATQITDFGADAYPVSDRSSVWEQAFAMLDGEKQRQLARTEIRAAWWEVDNMSIEQQASEASQLLQTFAREGEDGGSEFNPWTMSIVAEAEHDARALVQIIAESALARGLLEALGSETPFVDEGTPAELFHEGIDRAFALVGRGIMLLSQGKAEK